jgi:hypothetical protein
MPQSVRRERRLETDSRRQAAHQGEYSLSREAPPAVGEEDLSSPTISLEARPLGREVSLECTARGPPERHHTLAIAFADHANGAVAQVESLDGQRHHLSDPESAAIENFEQCAIAERRCRSVRHGEQALEVRLAGGTRQASRLPRLSHVALGETEEAAKRGEPARLGPRGDSPLGLRRLEAEHQLATHASRLSHAEALAGESGEARQIVAIRGMGIWRDSYLRTKPRQMPVDELVE